MRISGDRMNNEKIDWHEISRRLEEIKAAIERGVLPDASEKKKVLKARAELLAKQPEDTTTGERLEVVEFMLAQERYGIESSYVREVYPLKEYTPLPCTPRFVLGLINVRGQIISVIDIKKFFDMPEKGFSDLNKVIILSSDKHSHSKVEGMEFGILADSILGVENIAVSGLQPSLPTLSGIREKFFRGIASERMVVLDAGKLLADKNITVHEEVN